jgi:hypothetical protein
MGTKITALPQVVTPTGADELPISQDTGSGSRITYKATLDQLKNFVKTTGSGTGTVSNVAVTSPDGSIDVFGSPINSSGTITLNISSVGLNKLANGGAINGQVLTYNGTTWVASAVPTELPSGTNGQVLTHNGTTWVASAASNLYTTVGNASAGIFASAVCFIPSDPGTGTWTAPAGCFTARVTIVGGGGVPTNGGGRSHFNYPTGITTAANEMFAAGGATNAGGNAGWNGINNLAIGGTTPSAGGSGGPAGGGYGGGGGRGGNVISFGGAGASFGNAGINGVVGGGVTGGGGGGGSGGVGGDGGDGVPSSSADAGPSAGGSGGGSPTLSYAATLQTNFRTAISQSPGRGCGGSSSGAAGWCSAIVSVVPGQSYSYAVGAAGGAGASYGMVVIEW